MPEMYLAMKLLYGKGLAGKTALITDGRFSGSNNGCFVGHISPEAAEGGPIALVEDNDLITIDIPNKTLTVEVNEETLNKRRSRWRRPESRVTGGYLKLYSQLASSASKGAVLSI